MGFYLAVFIVKAYAAVSPPVSGFQTYREKKLRCKEKTFRKRIKRLFNICISISLQCGETLRKQALKYTFREITLEFIFMPIIVGLGEKNASRKPGRRSIL
nr:hypothetical protein [Candidatus Sigynarchaeota archaeon]